MPPPNEVLRVPLLLVAPALQGGRVVAENVSLLDVAPTILELAGAAPEQRFEGRSLVPLIAGHLFLTLVNPSTRGSLRGIVTGYVDAAWAAAHHSRWKP